MLDIISCSRRTDIPAFYYDWLQECLENKYVMVKNPFNKSSYMVDLSPDSVHSICLWSKSFANVLKSPKYLSYYNLYFQFTITGYSRFMEPCVIDTDLAVKQMEQLAGKYSPRQINWRFDPIIICLEGEKSLAANDFARSRLQVFENLCRDISSFGVNRCTISYLQLYKKIEQALKKSKLTYVIPSIQEQIDMTTRLAEIADKYRMEIYTCSSPLIEAVPGVKKGHCIDGAYLEDLFGKKASHAKDSGQRADCGCTRSKDIGAYDGQRCGHGCIYCYAMK